MVVVLIFWSNYSHTVTQPQLSWLSGVRTRAQRSGLWRSTKYLKEQLMRVRCAFSKKRCRARSLGLCVFAPLLSTRKIHKIAPFTPALCSPWPCLQSEEAVAVGDVHQLLSSKAHEVQESQWPMEGQSGKEHFSESRKELSLDSSAGRFLTMAWLKNTKHIGGQDPDLPASSQDPQARL